MYFLLLRTASLPPFHSIILLQKLAAATTNMSHLTLHGHSLFYVNCYGSYGKKKSMPKNMPSIHPGDS